MNKGKTYEITITQDFVDYADAEFNKGSYSSRVNCDALFLEYYMIKHNLADAPQNWRHDVIKDGFKIDFKEIPTIYFNIPNDDKVAQYMESFNMQELDMFLFFNSSRDKTKVLKAEDIVKGSYISELKPVDEVIRDLAASKFKGYYYRIN